MESVSVFTPLTNADFEYFRKRCRHYQKLFNLQNWEIWFEHVDLSIDDTMGKCTYDVENHQATISFAKLLPSCKDTDRTKKQVIDRIARHEMFHLVVGVLDTLTTQRCITDLEVRTAVEGLVRHIEQIYKAGGGK